MSFTSAKEESKIHVSEALKHETEAARVNASVNISVSISEVPPPHTTQSHAPNAQPQPEPQSQDKSSGQLINFPASAQKGALAATEPKAKALDDEDPLVIPFGPEPAPPDPRDVETSRRTEAINALLGVANMPEQARMFVQIIVARADGQVNVAMSDNSMLMDVPTSSRKGGRGDSGSTQWLKRGRRKLMETQAKLKIAFIEIKPGARKECDNGRGYVFRPTQYRLHILKMTDEVLSLISEGSLERTRPIGLDPYITDDDEKQLEADDAQKRSTVRSKLFRQVAHQVFRKHEGKYQPPPARRGLSESATILKNLHMIATLQRKTAPMIERLETQMAGDELQKVLDTISTHTKHLCALRPRRPKKEID